MKFTHQYARAAIGLALSAVTLIGQAADKPPVAAMPADADAAVPATTYQSLLSYTPAAATGRSPDQNWTRLNEQVGAYDSMALTMADAPEASPADAAQVATTAGKAAGLQERHSGPAHSAPTTADLRTDSLNKDSK